LHSKRLRKKPLDVDSNFLFYPASFFLFDFAQNVIN